MKKKLLSLAVASLVCGSVAEAEFYLGVEGGYNGNLSTFTYEDNGLAPSSFKQEIKEKGVVGNVVLGTEHFFGSGYFGLRWGVFAGYGSSWGGLDGEKTRLDTISMGANFDMFANFVAKENLMSGLFVGVEYAYTLLRPKEELFLGKTYTTTVGNTSQSADYYVSNKTASNTAVVRVGLSTKIAKHHRLEVMAKVPVIFSENTSSFSFTNEVNGQIVQKIDDTFKFNYKYIQGLVSYKYVF